MKIIEELTNMIDEELGDAEKYARCALEKKEKYPMLAQTFYTLSNEELKHSNMLHDEAVRIINDFKAKGETVPEAMQAVYDYLHKKRISRTSDIKIMLEQFKTQ